MTAGPRRRLRPPVVAALLLALMGCWLVVAVGTAAPASAHAVLQSTDPADGARLAAAPRVVTLTFDEAVSLGAGYARVVTVDGVRADTGAARASGATVTIPLRSGLPDAGYVVTYRVTSDDSHPVGGTFSFVVGDAAAVAPGTAAAGPRTDAAVAAVLPVARWLGFAGLALAVGVPVLLLTCWPGGWAERLVRRLVRWGLAAVGAGAAVGFLVQGPYAAGSGLGSMFDPGLLSATAGSEYGRALIVRMVLVLALAAVLLPVRTDAPARWRAAAGGLLALGLVLTMAAVGHPVAGSSPVPAVLVAAVHVGAMAVWVGGLLVVLVGLLRPGLPAGALAAALPRFSRLAFAAVAALVLSGIVQAVREVGSPSALVSTTYGRVLTAKLVLVLVILAAAGVSRVWVQQHMGTARARPGSRRGVTAHAFSARDGAADAVESGTGPVADDAAPQEERAVAELPALRRSVLVELAVAVVVLALSAVLVGSPPASAVVAQPVDVTLPVKTPGETVGSVQVSLDPARPGANTLHLYLFDRSGRQLQPTGVRVTLTEPEQRIGPTDVWLQPAGPGHYISERLTVPVAGKWRMELSVGLGGITAGTASTTITVR